MTVSESFRFVSFHKNKMLLLQNVERGSRMMTKLRGTESPLEYCIDDAIIEMHRITPIPRKGDESIAFNKWCVWRDEITPHKVSRSASAHYRRSIKQWHHCSSSGVEDSKEIQFEKLVIQSIFPIEMILNKYFLKESIFSSKLSNLQSTPPPNES